MCWLYIWVERSQVKFGLNNESSEFLSRCIIVAIAQGVSLSRTIQNEQQQQQRQADNMCVCKSFNFVSFFRLSEVFFFSFFFIFC